MPTREKYWKDAERSRAENRAAMKRHYRKVMECPIRAETYRQIRRQMQKARREAQAELRGILRNAVELRVELAAEGCREECAKRLKKAEYMRNYFQARQAKKVKKVEAKVAQAGLNEEAKTYKARKE